MRLVVVATREGDLVERRRIRCVEQVDRAAEAHRAADELRRQADVVAESGRKMLPAAAERGRELGDPRAAVRRAQTLPRPRDVCGRRRRTLEPPGKSMLDDREPSLPRLEVVEALFEPTRVVADEVFEVDDLPRELVHGDAEDHPRADRGKVDLDAAHLAVVADLRAAVVETADQVAEPAAVDDELAAEAEDDDDARRKPFPASRRPAGALEVAPVAVDVRVNGRPCPATDE